MNKQKLTKTFSFSKWLLFFFFAVGLTLSSCGEDYDDDIEDLRNKWESVKDYQATKDKLASLETSLAQAKASAEQAAKDAAEALAAANKIGDVKAIADASAKVAAEAAKAEAIADADAKLKALEKKLQDQIDALITTGVPPVDKEAIIKDILKSLDADMKALEEAISKVIGHRLTSIAFIPDLPHGNINGIAAMRFYSLSYVPQVFHSKHDSLQHTTVAAGKGEAVSLSNQELTVRYRMNPRVGVRTEDLLMPSFDCIISENDITRSTAVKPGVNIPIKPVAAGVVREDGVYELKVTKSVANDIDREWLISNDSIERFYMASLNVPIADSGLTAEEIENGTKPSVHSEYVRIADKVVTPFLKQAGTLAHDHSDDVYEPGTSPNIFPHLNEQDGQGRYLHYHDSTALYHSLNGDLVDHYIDWNKGVDLKKLVDVCIIDNRHASLENYKGYGLTFRFYLADKAYKQGTNETDQQQFAVIDNPQNGFMTSKTYTIGGNAQTAIDREPIVRAMLVDTINNKLVAQRYIKLKWVTAGEDLPVYKFPDYYVSCDTVSMRFGTQAMNEAVYRQVLDIYGLSKTAFHALYDNVAIDTLKQDGKVITAHNLSINEDITKDTDVINSVAEGTAVPEAVTADYTLLMLTDPDPNMSWNLLWTMNPEAVGKVGTPATPRKSTYELFFKFTSTKGGQAIRMKFVVDIKIPDQIFNYVGTYWKNEKPNNGTGIFNVNPIVYDTPSDGAVGPIGGSPTDLKDYSHIEADLVNGWIYKKGTGELADGTDLKPANLAQFIRMIRSCAEVQFVFDKDRFKNYSYLKDYVVGKNNVAVSNNTRSWKDAVELWKGTVGISSITPTYLTGDVPSYAGGQEETPTDNYDYIQNNAMAASISNIFGATALENKKNLAWNKDEILGVGGYLDSGNKGIANGVIRLHETDKLNGTSASRELIGKNVPVNLIVEYNPYNIIAEQKFEVHFIDPLKVNSNISGNFEDAVVNGSYLDANKGLTFTDWNDYLVSRNDTVSNAPAKEKYQWQLWNYYGVNSVTYHVDSVKTSLKWQGSVLVNDNAVSNGPLPTGASLKQVKLTWDPVTKDWDYVNYTAVTVNPTHLGYFNNAGTPVNANYWLYIPLTVNYKWGVITGQPVKAQVVKAGGTPSNPNP